MGMARSVAGVLVFGLILILADAALGGSWPSHSAGSWLLFIGGLVVIGVAFHVAQAMHESRGKHR